MNEFEKYRAQVEAKMNSFNESIEEVIAKAKRRNATSPEVDVDRIVAKHETAKAKVKALETTDETKLQKIQHELVELFDDMDEDLRQAIAYFG